MEPAEYERTYRLEQTHWWFISRQHLTAALLKPHFGPDSARSILDVGCGTGGNLKLLQNWGRVTGVDLQALPLDFARRQRRRLAQASALTLPFPTRTFALVTAFDVLYHRWVTDDAAALSEFYRVLQPGGRLLITDSALPWLWSEHDRLYHARRRYTAAELRGKVTAAGFMPQVCSYVNSLLLPPALAARWLMSRLPLPPDWDMRPLPAGLNRLLIATRRLETVWLSRGHSLPAGSSVVCLARR